jgi:hypothetical protein
VRRGGRAFFKSPRRRHAGAAPFGKRGGRLGFRAGTVLRPPTSKPKRVGAAQGWQARGHRGSPLKAASGQQIAVAGIGTLLRRCERNAGGVYRRLAFEQVESELSDAPTKGNYIRM